MIRRSLQHFHPRRQPWMTRQSYSHELTSVMTFPLALAMVEGGTIAALANKAFAVPPALFATIMAAPMFANLSSFFWARLAQGRGKVRVINVLQVALLVTVAAVALLPTHWPGPVLLTLLMIAARCIICGIVTVRSTVWRMNYPRHVRARLTSRLVLIHVLILAFAPLIAYAALDINDNAFRVVYPVMAVTALIGVVAYSRIRLRGEKELLRHETARVRRFNPQAESEPYYEYDPARQTDTTTAPRETILSVLRNDRPYRHYLTWHFISGLGMQMSQVAIVHLITERLTRDLTLFGWRIEYFTAIALTVTIPMGVAVLTMPLFARYFDRVHIAAFRSFQAKWWVVLQITNFFAAYLAFHHTGSIALPLALVSVARVLQGVCQGGGVLAFNLGHNDFAKRHDATLYMGLNVSAAGVRGIVAAFLGMGLYLGWESRHWLGITLPAFAGIGPYVFLITTACTTISLFGFTSLSRSIARAGQVAPTD
ncbi:MAG: MFS transporter [Phycisphaeraceae bacterium]